MKINQDNIIEVMEKASKKLKEVKCKPTNGWIYSDGEGDIVILSSKEGQKQIKKILNDIS